jgi:hypothetical protein
MLDVMDRVRELLNEYRQAKQGGPDASTSAHDVRYSWLRVEYETTKRSVNECPDCAKAAASLTWPNEDPAGTPALQDAIRQLHGCESRWIESVPVREEREGKTVWDGVVQVFVLVGHPKAKRAYAWSHATEGTPRRFHVVLGIPPVDGPVMAVRTEISVTRR